MSKNTLVNEYLKRLVAEACLHAPMSKERQKILNELVRSVEKSGQLWQEKTPYYDDALQQTWLYLCDNLERYDAARGTLIIWLDKYLKWRLSDFRQTNRKEESRSITAQRARTKEIHGWIEVDDEEIGDLPTRPDIPTILEETRRWVETDLSKDLRKTHVRGRPDVNCQILILLRLPPQTPWETIARRFQLSESTALNFYKQKAMPRLRNFGLAQGYLD